MAKTKFKDPRGAHIRVYWSLLDSAAWFALGYSQRALYIACRRKLTSNNNGNIAFTLNGLAEQGFDASSSTLAGGLRALLAVGFIAVTREGGQVRRGQAIATLYRFTDEQSHGWPKLDIPLTNPTNEWNRFEHVEAARAAIHTAELTAQATYASVKAQRVQRLTEKNPSIRVSNRPDSKFKAVPIRKSKSETISDFENRSVSNVTQRARTTVQ